MACLTCGNRVFQHVVQNQMAPGYAYPQAGLEEYPTHQVVSPVSAGSGMQGVLVSTALSSEPSASAIYTTPAAVSVTANGAVEQQTVRARPFNVR
jgi:hypothetical protein